jgi:hypothetical protein
LCLFGSSGIIRVEFQTKYRHSFGPSGIDSCGKNLLRVRTIRASHQQRPIARRGGVLVSHEPIAKDWIICPGDVEALVEPLYPEESGGQVVVQAGTEDVVKTQKIREAASQ